MDTYNWDFQDRAFFERYDELSDKQIRVYLGLRRTITLLRSPEVKAEAQEIIDAGRGGIGMDQVDLVMDIELLCEKGLIRRERRG
jgi:hypothetical protein